MFGEISKPGGLSNILVWACDSSFMRKRAMYAIIDIPVDRENVVHWLIIGATSCCLAYRQATSLAQLRAMKLTFGLPAGSIAAFWRTEWISTTRRT